MGYNLFLLFSGKSESTVRRIVNEGFKNDGKFETPGKHRTGRPKKEMDDCHHVEMLEKEYYERGHHLYQDIDELIIRLGDDSSSDDSAADESGNETFFDVEYLESVDE